MKDITKKILLALGFTEAQITDMESDAPTGVITELVAHATEHQKTLLKNDATFIDEITSPERGRFRSEMEIKIKDMFALSHDEVKDIKREKGMYLNGLLEVARKKSLAKGNKSLEDLQKENMDLSSKVKELTETEIPKIRAEVDQAKKKINTDFKAIKMLDGVELAVNRSAAEERLLLRIERDYDIEENDKGEMIFKDKKTGLQVKNADGTKLLTPKEIILADFEQAGFLKKSGGVPANPAPDPLKKPDGSPAKKSEGVVAAEQNLKENMPKANA